VEFRILGPLEVLSPAGPVPLGGPKQRALLGVLLLEAGAVVPTDRLVTALWGEDPPDSAVNVVQGHVGDLRRLLGRETVLTRPPGYALGAAAEDVDAHRFEGMVCEGRRRLASDPAAAAALLRDALALWRGPVLADVVPAGVESAITRLEELRLTALEDRVEADLRLGRRAELVAELQALLAAHPGRERLCGQLMLALYRSGRQEEALAAYRSLSHRFREELGIDPSPELQRLERAILRHEASLLLPLPAADTPPAEGTARAGDVATTRAAAAASPPTGLRPRVALLVTAAAVVLGVSTVGVLRTSSGSSSPSASCPRETPFPRPRSLGPGLGVVAHIAHSCDANSEGVWPRSAPAHDSPRVPPALGEGTLVHVVCQRRHGGLVVDDKLGYSPQPSSTVWDRLEDGTWVSDVYTTLPKQAAETPPLGLQVC
jgi:DNA-binding SARP family transcriptional activator